MLTLRNHERYNTNQPTNACNDHRTSFHPRFTNLSEVMFTEEEINTFNLGHKFSPYPNKIDLPCLAIDLELQTKKHPEYNNIASELTHLLRKHSNLEPVSSKEIMNSKNFQKNIEKIKEKLDSNNLIVTKADKNAGLVILNKSIYIEKTLQFFEDNNIKEIKNNPMLSYNNKLNPILKKCLPTLQKLGAVNIHTIKEKNPRIPVLYSMIKLHKPDKSIRPITSAVNSPANKISKVLNNILVDKLKCRSKYSIRNSIELIEELKSINLNKDNTYLLLSFDVVNLYTNVPVEQTLSILKDHLHHLLSQENHFQLEEEDVENILSLINLATKQNFFAFWDKIYIMTNGLPMGSSLSGAIAEAYLDFIEKRIMSLPLSEFIVFWRRYVDDIFCIWSGSERDLDSFLELLNSQFGIKFTLEKASDNTINFLDLRIQLKLDGTYYFEFDIYRKPTSTDVIIPYDSHHPPHIKKAAFNFLLHRLNTVPLSVENYKRELEIIYTIGLNNKYPKSYIDNIIQQKKKKELLDKKIFPHHSINLKYISIPFCRNLNYNINSILQKYNYYVTNKGGITLENILVNNKPKIKTEQKSGVYKIECEDCQAYYVGMTTRSASIRFSEHVKNKPSSALGNHLIDNNHKTSIHSLSILHYEKNFYRLTLLEQLEILRRKHDSNLVNDVKEFPLQNIFKMFI